MRFIRDDSHQARYNLALEEYLLQIPTDEMIVRIWQNGPSVIVGKYQNTAEELNHEYIKARGVEVVRRLTGGGAVYHDLGNVNYTIVDRADGKNICFEKFTRPIIAFLRNLGVDAALSGRNDMLVGGLKFSGNAQLIRSGRVLHHGTLLYSADLDAVAAALKVRPDKIASNSVKSVRSRVGNLKGHLPAEWTAAVFAGRLLEALRREFGGREYVLTEADRRAVQRLYETRYNTWEWNYGASPRFTQERRRRFPWGEVIAGIVVKDGVVETCSLRGDFFCGGDIEALENVFKGARHSEPALRRRLAFARLKDYLPRMADEELLALLL